MSSFEIVFYSLCLAFVWVEIFNPFKKLKPFNCIPCMTGWISLILSVIYGFELLKIILLMAVGVFIGALYEQIKMRWL